MARLIIGPTTHNSARIWIRGHERYPFGFVTLESAGVRRSRKISLEERHFFTGVAEFRRLEPDTEYRCRVCFGHAADDREADLVDFGQCRGRFRTFPPPGSASELVFLTGSCNLHSLGIVQNPDPAYRRLREVAESEAAAFMIHCGDQIYYDVPNAFKQPTIEGYRDKYLDAWSDSRAARKFLTRLPHYMILDDHEMVNNFANDVETLSGVSAEIVRDVSLKVYREFVHIRHATAAQRRRFGEQALYYEFAHGEARFFVLDARTERVRRDGDGSQDGPGQMISPIQMQAFLAWLKKHRKAVKFVVSSVPFVGELRNSDDKWNGRPFVHQREEILAFLLRHDIRGLTFLAGDLHSSYHGRLEVSDGRRRLTVHELTSSPINQIGKRSFGHLRVGETTTSRDGTFSYTSQLARSEFYDEHSNAMLIKVRERTVDFEVFRTKKDARREIVGSFEV